MHRLDDLGAVDSLEVDAGDPQIAMPELALDRHERHTLVGEFDSVGMPQLMWGKSTSDASGFRCATQLFASRGGLPAPPGGYSVDYAEQRPDRQDGANLKVRGQLIPRPPVHAYLATPPAFASAHGEGSARAVDVGLGEVECFADPQPGSPEDDDQRSQAGAVRVVDGGAHDGGDLLDGWRGGRGTYAFVFLRAGLLVARDRHRRTAVGRGG